MRRKILILVFALFHILLLLAVPTLAVESSPLLVHEPFEYEIPGNWTSLGSIGNGGEGWGSRWAGDKVDFSTPCPGSPRVTLTPDPISDRAQIKNGVTIYRKLASALSSTKDGEYIVDVSLTPRFAADGTVMKWEIGFSDNVSYGFEDKGDGNGLHSFIKAGMSTIYSTATYNAGEMYNTTFRISVDGDGQDRLYFRATAAEEDSSSWDVNAAAELVDLDYMSINAPNSTSYILVHDIKIYSYDVDAVKAFDSFLEKEEALTEEDCVKAVDAVSNLAEGAFKASMFNTVLKEAEKLGINDILKNRLVDSNPANTAHVYAEDIEKITLSYRYKLKSIGTVANISDGDNVTEGEAVLNGKLITITPASPLSYNKSYTVTLDNPVSFDDSSVNENVITFTTSIVPAIDIVDNGTYGEGRTVYWVNYDGITTTATVKVDGGDEVEFTNGTAFSTLGEYLLTLHSSENDGVKTEEREYSFTVLPAYAPEAKNRRIKGNMVTGETIEAAYDFYDKNDDAEGTSVYQWYSSESLNGEYLPITLNGNSKHYTLTENDENKYLKFSVTPIAVSVLKSTGETVECDGVCGAFKPTATDVKIEMKKDERMAEGAELTAKFIYNDLNGNENEAVHSIVWYSKDADSLEEKLGEGKNYTVLERDFNKQIFIRVTPKTTVRPFAGATVDSEMLYAPTKPTAKNVEITGTAKDGQTIGGVYNFYDVNGDDEADTTGYWINANSGKKIKEGHFLKLTSNMVGMEVKYVVCTKSVSEPKEGDAVESSAVRIASNGSDSGDFIHSGNTSGSTKTEKNNSTHIVKPSQPQTTIDRDSFSDLKGHWAESCVKDLKKAELISGVNEAEFAPEQNVNRAEFVVMMVRLAGWDSVPYNDAFSDVKSEDWYSGSIAVALEKGLISKDESFRPKAFITRAEASKLSSIISKLIEYKADENSEEITFADSNAIASWAESYIEDVAKKGIMLGDDEGNIRANDTMTRAEAATIMWRLYKGGSVH